LFEFNKLPTGISVGCQGLSRVIDELIADLKGKFVFNFLDELVVYSASARKHESHVHDVLSRLQKAGFTLNPDKVVLWAAEIKYLGHLLSRHGVKILPERVAAIQEYPRPFKIRSLRRFVGMVGFYARFIPRYADIVGVLHGLKKKFAWGEQHQAAFESLKRALCEALVLQIPDFTKDFTLVTNANDQAVSAVPHQWVADGLAPIAFYSRVLTSAERQYSTYEKECLAVLFGCEKCCPYLEHKEFVLYYDYLALCWLLRRVKDVGCLRWWIVRLASFKFKVKHTRSVDNFVADTLSCMYIGEATEDTEALCGALLESLPLVYSSLEQHQNQDGFCVKIREELQEKRTSAKSFRVFKDLLCYFPKRAKRCWWVVPPILRPMLLKYFHDEVLSAHLGACKNVP